MKAGKPSFFASSNLIIHIYLFLGKIVTNYEHTTFQGFQWIPKTYNLSSISSILSPMTYLSTTTKKPNTKISSFRWQSSDDSMPCWNRPKTKCSNCTTNTKANLTIWILFWEAKTAQDWDLATTQNSLSAHFSMTRTTSEEI